MTRIAAAAVPTALLAGCLLAAALTPATVHAQEAATTPAAVFAAGGAPPSSRYQIAASDVLTVKYRYSPEYDYTGAVPPDGYVSLPFVGDLRVAGMTVAEAEDAIRAKASERLRDPKISVEVKEFERPRFFVGGEVASPGQYELRGQITVLEAIAMAKGFKTSAKHSQIVLFRRADADHMFTRVLNAKDLAKPVPQQEVLLLQPNDFLLVPQNKFSKAVGAVPLVGIGVLLGNALLW